MNVDFDEKFFLLKVVLMNLYFTLAMTWISQDKWENKGLGTERKAFH